MLCDDDAVPLPNSSCVSCALGAHKFEWRLPATSYRKWRFAAALQLRTRCVLLRHTHRLTRNFDISTDLYDEDDQTSRRGADRTFASSN
jgi:hypothetical protein